LDLAPHCRAIEPDPLGNPGAWLASHDPGGDLLAISNAEAAFTTHSSGHVAFTA
jgi:hypothetical protein